jgi:outer membrane lipoprotein-sorting protein
VTEFLTALLLFPALLLTAAEDPAATALALMDANAAVFKGVSTDITRVTHNAFLNSNHTEAGAMLLKRPAPRDMRVLITFPAQTVSMQGKTAQVYTPTAKMVQVYDATKFRSLFDQFFLLGFGSSGKELAAAYDVSPLGDAPVNGEKTLHLQLIPKEKKVRDQLAKVELWLSAGTGYPVQQQLFFPNGDYQTITYSALKINPNINDSSMKLKLPKDVQTTYPAK